MSNLTVDMSSPPWLDGNPSGPPMYGPIPPQPSTGLSALERMLDSTPCEPSKQAIQQNGSFNGNQQWSANSASDPAAYPSNGQWYGSESTQEYQYQPQNEVAMNYPPSDPQQYSQNEVPPQLPQQVLPPNYFNPQVPQLSEQWWPYDNPNGRPPAIPNPQLQSPNQAFNQYAPQNYYSDRNFVQQPAASMYSVPPLNPFNGSSNVSPQQQPQPSFPGAQPGDPFSMFPAGFSSQNGQSGYFDQSFPDRAAPFGSVKNEYGRVGFEQPEFGGPEAHYNPGCSPLKPPVEMEPAAKKTRRRRKPKDQPESPLPDPAPNGYNQGQPMDYPNYNHPYNNQLPSMHSQHYQSFNHDRTPDLGLPPAYPDRPPPEPPGEFRAAETLENRPESAKSEKDVPVAPSDASRLGKAEDDEDDEDKKTKNNLRKNIKDIRDETTLDERTRNAQKEEQERMKRLQEQRQKAVNSLKELRGQLPAPNHDKAVIVETDEDEKQRKDVIDISSGDEDDKKDVINVSDSEDEEELDLTSNVHPFYDELGRVLINVGHADDEEDIFIAPQLAHVIKPHQIGGVRFLFENVIESTRRFNTTSGFGCILAHSMGLGKTIQVVTFSDVFLRHTSGRKILIITPINTIQNWQAEFDKWLPREDQVFPSHVSEGHVRPRGFPVFLLNEVFKTTIARHRVIKEWDTQGGVMLMGYEMYRMLALKKTYKPKGRKKANTVMDTEESLRRDRDLLEGIYRALVDPGPDLVVCDEGHRIKNCNASTSSALKDIRTRRRVVLTGYPLQNNLLEYWCMVDFVRPSYLGTKMEFTNMFERPIQNGQCVDSTPNDRQLMKFRAHVLHSLLLGFVQRRGHGVLKDALPTKEEHVILIRMTEIQRSLYSALVREFVTNSESANPLKIFAVCCKIWNHPDILYNLVRNKKGLPPTAIMDLDIDEGGADASATPMRKLDDPHEMGDGEGEEDQGVKKKRGRKKKEVQAPVDPASRLNDDELNKISYEWAYDLMADYKPDVVENSYKFVLLMEMIDTALKVGDKLLVFSQSLLTLDVVERFLLNREMPARPGLPYMDKWSKNRTYFRLDGSTSGQDRERLINDFNHNPCVSLFLLSTRAGCLGINLIGANRIIVLDASWNPCHDAQAVCRVYRYGQQKPCFIYRFVCDNSLEKRIYDRQVNKQGMSDRVVDEMNPEAKLTWKDVSTLIQEDETDPPIEDFSGRSETFTDPLMRRVVAVSSSAFTKLPFEHESLLLDQKDQKLTKYEKKQAKMSYEREKKAAQYGGRVSSYNTTNMVVNGRSPVGTLGNYNSRYVRDPRTGQMVPTNMGPNSALIFSLIRNGMTVQKMRIPRSTTIGLMNEPPVLIPAGSELLVMKTPRGVYLRLPCERVVAMRLPQTLDQLCMARPSPFRPIESKKPPEVINLDEDSESEAEDTKAKPKVITIESETISKNKGLFNMLTKDYNPRREGSPNGAANIGEDMDILGRMSANKNLQLQVTEIKPERKARMKITQRKRNDLEFDRAQIIDLNGGDQTTFLDDSDTCHDSRNGNASNDEDFFDLAMLSGEISVSAVDEARKGRMIRDKNSHIILDDDVPSFSNDTSQGSISDTSTESRRNPLLIQNLEQMLGDTKAAHSATRPIDQS